MQDGEWKTKSSNWQFPPVVQLDFLFRKLTLQQSCNERKQSPCNFSNVAIVKLEYKYFVITVPFWVFYLRAFQRGIIIIYRQKGRKAALFCFVLFSFIFISWSLITLQYCSGFCHTLTWISHGCTCVPHPETPPTSLPIPSLWVIPVHQPQALVSCIQPGLAICFTLDNIAVSMLFSQIIPPLPSPTESKSLFYTSVSLFLSCI